MTALAAFVGNGREPSIRVNAALKSSRAGDLGNGRNWASDCKRSEFEAECLQRQLIIMHIPFEEEAVLARGAGIETPSVVRTSIAADSQRESVKCWSTYVFQSSQKSP
jgi:hypothetical protein